MIDGLPSFGWTKNKFQDLFSIQPQLFILHFLFSVGWLDDFLAGARGLNFIFVQPQPRRAVVGKIGYLEPRSSKITVKGSNPAWPARIFHFPFFIMWLVGWTISWPRPRILVFVQPQLFILPFFVFSVGWLDTFLAAARG